MLLSSTVDFNIFLAQLALHERICICSNLP